LDEIKTNHEEGFSKSRFEKGQHHTKKLERTL